MTQIISCSVQNLSITITDEPYVCIFSSEMPSFDNHAVCNMNIIDVNEMIQPCSVKINDVAKFLSCKRNEPASLPLKYFDEKSLVCV